MPQPDDAPARFEVARIGRSGPTEPLGEYDTDRGAEPDDEHPDHPGSKTEQRQECAAPGETRADAEAHVHDQAIPSPVH
ncbi:MAG TPA: hypothetical protein VJU81_20550 [Methylomirabilota bacterium]|nr:hypothetical protein [Methylomirabilota bacterium]